MQMLQIRWVLYSEVGKSHQAISKEFIADILKL